MSLTSRATERIGMYERFGFRTLGPAVADGQAAFAPMALPLGEVPAVAVRLAPDWPAFRAYVDGMLAGDVLSVSPAAARSMTM